MISSGYCLSLIFSARPSPNKMLMIERSNSIAYIYKNPQNIERLPKAGDSNYFMFVLMTKEEPGGLSFNGMDSLDCPALAMLPPKHIKRDFCGSLHGYILGVNWEYLKRLPHWSDMGFVSGLYSTPWKALDSNEAKMLTNYFSILPDVIRNYDRPFGSSIFKNILQALTALCIKHHPSEWINENTTRMQDISSQFIKIVSENFESNRELSFYAKKLFITPKYLSDVISRTTGRNATKWIEAFTMKKAKQMLAKSDEPISTISQKLNFYTPSDFCKYFKKSSGTTPLQYRKSNK